MNSSVDKISQWKTPLGVAAIILLVLYVGYKLFAIGDLLERYQENSVFEKYVQYGKLEDCATLGSEYEQDLCYMTKAGRNKNASMCGMVVDVGVRDTCMKTVATVSRNDKEKEVQPQANAQESASLIRADCSVEGFQREYCYFSSSLTPEEAAFCGKIDDCFWGRAMANNDSSLCIKIVEQERLLECRRTIKGN